MNIINILKKFNKIFNYQQRLKILIIAGMMVIGAGLEMIGVSLILPLISVIMNPSVLEENRYAVLVSNILHIQSEKEFIIFLILLLMAVFVFKNLYLFLEYYVQIRFVHNNRFLVQKKLLETYLHRSYEFFLGTNLAEINRVLMFDIVSAFGLLTTVLSFFTEAVVVLFLIALIIIVDPLMAI